MAFWQGKRAWVMQMKNQRFLYLEQGRQAAEDNPLGPLPDLDNLFKRIQFQLRQMNSGGGKQPCDLVTTSAGVPQPAVLLPRHEQQVRLVRPPHLVLKMSWVGLTY